VARVRPTPALAALVLLLPLTACQWPRDAEGTLDRVAGGTVRVGLVESEPWVVLDDDEPAGVEVRLVEELADQLDADVEWVRGSESAVMEALHVRALDLVVGGLVSSAPWQEQASLTRHYLTTRTVVAVPSGDDTSTVDTLRGRPVAVERGTADVERVRTYDVVPVPVPDVADVGGPVVVDEWRLDDLGLRGLDAAVGSSEHVVAVPLGENAWQTTVERFLLTRSGEELARLLDQEQP
jgi:polar amino acid transport system substrate-binding protein